MQSTSERVEAVKKRTEELRARKRRQKSRLIECGFAAASLVIIVAASYLIPGLKMNETGEYDFNGAAAGVFAGSSVPGYVIISILAFVLGCSFTILCFRLRKKDGRNRHDGDH